MSAKAKRILTIAEFVHGDITPGNVLVYEDQTGDIVVKVSDLGFATPFDEDEEHRVVTLPRCRPWNAPEFFDFGKFSLEQAKQMDIYSVGLLCLWVLFGDQFSKGSVQDSAPQHSSISFERPLDESNIIEDLKENDKLRNLASDTIRGTSALSVVEQCILISFFNTVLNRDPEKRTLEFSHVQDLTHRVCNASLFDVNMAAEDTDMILQTSIEPIQPYDVEDVEDAVPGTGCFRLSLEPWIVFEHPLEFYRLVELSETSVFRTSVCVKKSLRVSKVASNPSTASHPMLLFRLLCAIPLGLAYLYLKSAQTISSN